jgi:tetratricopeptide (TPR) repeat protein
LVKKALELDPALAEAWASSGLIALYREQYDRAESVLRRAIDLNPNYAPARQWYSQALVSLGRLEEALAQMQRAAELDPLSAVIKVNLGGTLTDVGRFREAEAAYRSAILLESSMPSAYWLLSNLNAYAFNRFVEAVPLAEKAMQLDPVSPLSAFPLARLHFDLGDDSKVLETLPNAAERWPDAPLVQLQVALVNLVRRDATEAVRHAERAFEMKPQLHLPLAILRNADMQTGRDDAALTRYKQAHPELFAHGSPSVHLANYRAAIDLALVLQKRGENEAAKLLLDGAARVIRTIPRLGIAGYWLSDVTIHALRGQKAEALAALRDAEKAGWRGPFWRYYRDFDPNIASIRDEPEFKAVFAVIERDLAQQRARLAARPKDAPLDLTARTSESTVGP